MNQDEIYDMAKQAGIENDWSFDFKLRLETFAKLVAAKATAKEREVCANQVQSWNTAVTDQIAAEIRARGEQEPWCMKMNGCKTKCEDCPDKPPPTPQRTWVGLTDDEQYQICNSNYNRESELVKMIEAKLKQKNGYAEEKNT